MAALTRATPADADPAGTHCDATSRDVAVDAAKGLALILTLGVQFSFEAARHGAPGFEPVYAVLNLIALPSFMVTAGLFVQKTINLPWREYARRKITSFCLAIALWAGIVTLVAARGGPVSFRLALSSAAAMTEQIPLLLIVPLFLLVARLFRGHVVFAMIVAVIAECLVDPGRTFGGELLRGLIYFYLGFRFPALFSRLAREAREDPPMAVSAIAVWLAIAALCVFVPVPLAQGVRIWTMPFATLGLGIAGAAIAFMGAALLAQNGVWGGLAVIGRNWIAVAVAAPLFLTALRGALLGSHVAAGPAHADLIIGVAALAGFLALAVIAIAQSWPFRPKAPVKPDPALGQG
jgi:uncharacterized membrane protein YcfT